MKKKIIVGAVIISAVAGFVWYGGSQSQKYEAKAGVVQSVVPTPQEIARKQINEMKEARKKQTSYVNAKAEDKKKLEASIADMYKRFESDWEDKALEDAVFVYETELDSAKHIRLEKLQAEKTELEAMLKEVQKTNKR